MSFLNLVFKVQNTYMVTGRGLVAGCDILKGGDKPDRYPVPVYWTDPSGEDRESAITGIERFAKFIGDDFERGDRAVGLLIRGAKPGDFEDGTIIYTVKPLRDLLVGGTSYSREVLKDMATHAIELWPEHADSYYAGQEARVGFFVGALMKTTGGRLCPGSAKEVVIEVLEERRP